MIVQEPVRRATYSILVVLNKVLDAGAFHLPFERPQPKLTAPLIINRSDPKPGARQGPFELLESECREGGPR